jgi:hypothetical protein
MNKTITQKNVETNNEKNTQYVLSHGIHLWKLDFINNTAEVIFETEIEYEIPSYLESKINDYCGNIINYLNNNGYNFVEDLGNSYFKFEEEADQ